MKTRKRQKKATRSLAPTRHLIRNRFYVASPLVMDGGSNVGWRRPSLEAAVQHARELCEKDGKDKWVVQVVRVVRRQPQPVIVEKV